MSAPELTRPLDSAELQATYPRAVAGMGEVEIEMLLELEEHALREQFLILRTDEEADTALRRAMLIGWQSFLSQLSQVTERSIGADSYREKLDADLAWPAMVRATLAPFMDPDAAGGFPILQLVRSW